MTLAEQVKAARKDRNWTQSDLAMRCGVTLRTIQRIEKGEVTPSAYTLGKLVELLALEQEKSSQNLSVKTHSLKSKLKPLATLVFSKKNLPKLLLMLTALTLIIGSIFWGLTPTPKTLAEGKTDQITFSTINCESTTSCDMQLTVRDLNGNIQLQKTYGGTS
jgi:transcriptional regulator with XRE-family HTH domain